jgi:hypothetical protein
VRHLTGQSPYRTTFIRRLGRDRELMGEHALGSWGRLTTGIALAVIVISVLALAVLAVA